MCSSRSDKLSPILNPSVDRRADGVSPEDFGEEDSTGFATHETPEDPQDEATDILPRDLQQKTATYDYAFEKSLSHAEAKLFYQHHQLSSASKGDSPASPIPTGRTAADSYDSKVTTGPGTSPLQVAREASMGGDEWHLGPSFQHDEASAAALQAQNSQLAADLSARNHAMPLGGANPSAHGAYLTATSNAEGIQGLGLGIGLSQGAAGSAPGGDAVTSELNAIYRKIKGLLERRSNYMALSLQRSEDDPRNTPEWEIYPPPPEPAWDEGKEYQPGNAGGPSDLVGKKRKMGEDIGEDFDIKELEPLPQHSAWTYRLDGNSVYQVYESETAADQQEPLVQIPSLRDFYMDLDAVVDVSTDGPTKSFAFKRLSYLEGKFQLYALLNEYQEIADSKKVPHRDFYNVRKVDTHVHHSACMNQKHLLRFIKSKMRKSPDEVVLFRDGKHLTLREVFESINLTAYDLSIDTLDMHVRSPETRSRFRLGAPC
jgi:AMP deaminase